MPTRRARGAVGWPHVMLLPLLVLPLGAVVGASHEQTEKQLPEHARRTDDPRYHAMQTMKLELWQRGVPECGSQGCADAPVHADDEVSALHARWAKSHALPIDRLRGGEANDGCAATTCEPAEADLDALVEELGAEFAGALQRNEEAHRADCAKSCESFYCGTLGAGGARTASSTVRMRSYSMGTVPPEDFAGAFRFPLDLIKVTESTLISSAEAEEVVATAVAEGVAGNEYSSGKYKLGGDWVKRMPRTLAWFNRRLEDTIFPTVAATFPEVVSSADVLRAHSVALLKYNASHPRTDIHVDDGILALTLALSPRANYTGGGTFFEHMGEESIVEMEQGQCTFRPGSVRHGGHRVSSGERYILGAFLLIEDRVEHVRRLLNQGRAARGRFDLKTARKYFKWALRINPKCATCLKNWAEAISARANPNDPLHPKLAAAAEEKLRRALELLPEDSDAWFSLGVLLSDQGRKAEAIDAYVRSVSINADDHELCYNLGVSLGDVGRTDEEVKMYRRALLVKPDFGKAWANLGAALASSGDFAGAEPAFIEAVRHDPMPNNWLNLARLYKATGRKDMAQTAFNQYSALTGGRR